VRIGAQHGDVAALLQLASSGFVVVVVLAPASKALHKVQLDATDCMQ